ncbi:hexokinase-1-like [Stegodyphus dumicola]|uniref:hexokinase-1-like n=1 Tax=Stegodyphus dumicola TaxID=202533 RepID=UPI0015B340E8|nr:hexokinase-1-like [Stegodyphus dumicola]
MTKNYEKAVDMLKDFMLPNNVLLKVSDLLLQEFNKGLSSACYNGPVVKMLPTFVRDVPDGSERGKFLALDLGGTRFRALCIDLKGDKCTIKATINYEIPESIMVGSGEELFDYIADCLGRFLIALGNMHRTLPLGFTFSFPCTQKGLDSAFLVNWTKGFNCSGVEGKDVVQLLREAVERKGGSVEVVAVINDTTGTLLWCAHKHRDCRVGLIVGTGTNACYMENLDNVETWSTDRDEPNQVIINTEWGAFGDNGCLDFLRTEIDRQIDENSINKGKQLFEKMISGMYMGEIVRRIVVKLANEGLMFKGNLSEKFKTPNAFKAKYVSHVDRDPKHKFTGAKIVLNKMGSEASDEDCDILKLVCERVSLRAANLVSAGVATILTKMKRNQTTIGIDGSVYQYHPHFKDLMIRKIEALTDPSFKFELVSAEDGSGYGAAIAAAVGVRWSR